MPYPRVSQTLEMKDKVKYQEAMSNPNQQPAPAPKSKEDETTAYQPDLIDEIAGDLSGKSRTYGYALIDDM